MEFSDLQRSWQAQAVPPPAPPAETTALLSETQRLHQFGRRRNWLATVLLLLSLSSFMASPFLAEGPVYPTQPWGLLLIAITLLAFIGAMWWGTTLRRAAQPGIASQAYLMASLRVFRFRRTLLQWGAVPYAVLLALGVLLLHWPRFHIEGVADWWKVVLWIAFIVGATLIGRRVGMRRYELEFGPAEQQLAQWQASWTETPIVGG